MKKQLAIIEKYRLQSLNRNRKCFESECDLNAVESHLLQKNGIISRIAEEGHVYESTYYTFALPYHLKFQRRGVNKVFAFKGFCQGHDNELFSPIEKEDFNLHDYTHSLLFAYRTLVNEIRKKEVIIEYYSNLKSDLSNPIPTYLLDESIEGLKMGINDSSPVLKSLNEHIKDSSKTDFIFHTYELPRIDLCVCGVYSFETSREINKMRYERDLKFFAPLTDVFLICLPFDTKSILSIGFLKGYNSKCDEFYNTLFSSKSNSALLQFLSNTLLLQCENWIISKKFYYDHIRNREDKILKILNWSTKNMNERTDIKFSLFK
jgi:hypothetical protein